MRQTLRILGVVVFLAGMLSGQTAPTVSAISPATGALGGGQAVTITGTGFTGATSVTIGGASATSVTVVSATSITARTPAGAAGTASVLVTTPGGTNAANTFYKYLAAPVLVSQSFVYIANYVDGTVSVINTATNTVSATVPVGSTPAELR